MKIGIDLGTTHSVVGVWKDGSVQLIPDMEGNILVPSAVGISEDNYILVGQAARDRLATNPDQTVTEFKRFMGTDKTFWLNDQEYSAIELSAILLKSLKEQAEQYLEEPVYEAVISVPAYFNNKQRQATQQAASLAGLDVERLLNEPTAAALAYGLDNQDSEQTYLVLDLGGGTFDVSVIEVFNEIFEIHASSGDNYLGGNDFTNVIQKDVYQKHNVQRGFLTGSEERNIWSLCDQLKRDLTEQSEASFEFQYKDEIYRYSLTNEDFRIISSELIERIKFPINRAMSDADLKVDEIDGLIFVGGATRMPIFQKQISHAFSRIPQTQYNPDHAIAIGAAIQAGMNERDKQLQDVIMTDVCPYTLGVEVSNKHGQSEFLPIIERNATIPVSETRSVYSAHPQQEKVLIKIYQGENYLPKDNVYMGDLEIDLEPLNKIQELYLTYTYDLNGVIEVEVTNVISGKKYRTYVGENSENMDENELRERFIRLNALKILPKDKLTNTAFKAKLERLFQESLGEKRHEVGEAIGQFLDVLETHDNHKIERMVERIKQYLNI
ncbi:molecular chaperone HscC [Marinomonas sp. CT5]|uniref:Hsp70 family protein n=1 Tax=Marinomonas sp. CT5 TaxID=2066133 RepID=UPI001BAF6CDB|nr:molecular chaperone HscC [Marinomonas sp. CT5]QUX94960.1 molecular chaperone HscC [Marinomonas sp. CT5]